MIKHEHKWIVYSTAICPPTIMVKCSCGATGSVTSFMKSEWQSAFFAPSKPYKWTGDNGLVVIETKKKGVTVK